VDRRMVLMARAGGGVRRRAAAFSETARTVFSRPGLRGTAIEAAWIAAHIATYPLGIAQERVAERPDAFSLQSLRPLQRSLVCGDVEAAGTPILLVHGLVDNRSIFTVLRRALRRRGFGRVSTYNYRMWTSDLRAAATRLGEQVRAVRL